MEDNNDRNANRPQKPGFWLRARVPFCAVAGALVISAVALSVALAANDRVRNEHFAAADVPSAEPTPPPPSLEPSATAEPSEEPTPEPSVEPSPPPNRFDLAALREQYNNPDIAGYLDIPDTNISYAVTHSTDNEYYLRRNEYGKNDNAGSIFMDYENFPNRLNYNTILYGHNMRKDIMFHRLRYYVLEEGFYEAHKYIVFESDAGPNVWEVFAVFRAETSFNYIQTVFFSEEQFLRLTDEMSRRSIIETGITVGPGDKILTLSTCSNEDPDTRFVVEAVRVKDISTLPEDFIVKVYGQEFYNELHGIDAPAATDEAEASAAAE